MAVMEPPNLFYRGSSMRGTFKPGDKLTIEKVPFDQISKGDLIIFSRNTGGENDFIVHRVAEITPDGLVTRGDNCLANDQGWVAEKNIFGRVIKYDRQGKINQARNGRAGALRATLLHGRLQVLRAIKLFFWRPYRHLKTSGLIAKIWRPKITILGFTTHAGLLVKYVRKDKTVAVCWIDQNYWAIKRPYEFVIWPQRGASLFPY